MLERIIGLERAINEFILETDGLVTITDSNWLNLKGLMDLLEPFWLATFDLSGQKYVSISLILPTVSFIGSGI
jgi:hypothetical protein